MKQKTFYKVLVEFNLYPHKVKSFFKDNRLTILEKKILEGYLSIRDNQNLRAIALVNSAAKTESPFIEAQKLLLIGIAQNNLGQFAQAEKNLLLALEILDEMKLSFFQFLARFNLFIISFNANDHEKMKKYISFLEGLKLDNYSQTNRLLSLRFMYYTHIEKMEQARKVLTEIEGHLSSFTEPDIISHHIVVFMFNVKNEDFDKCQETLQDMKKFRKYNLTDNFQFMKRLLDHLMHNDPLYSYNDDFKSIPILFHQFKLIQSMEENNEDQVKLHWRALQALHPDQYLEQFNFKGPKSLFSLCLEKHKVLQRVEVLTIARPNDASKLETLLKIFELADCPLPKGLLYEKIWGKTLESKEDLKKLTKLIWRLRTIYSIEIKTRKGTYYIEKKTLKERKQA